MAKTGLDLVEGAAQLLSQIATHAQEGLRGLHGRDATEALVMILDASWQKFRSWRRQWVEGHNVKMEDLWGKQGWTDIQDLLAGIIEVAEQIESRALYRQKSGSSSQSRLKRALTTIPRKDSINLESKRNSMSEMSKVLSGYIDQLWTYSDMTFDSLHGLLSANISIAVKDQLLDDVMKIRSGSLALYRACNDSRRDCCLEIGLVRRGMEARAITLGNDSPSTRIPNKLSYNLYTQTRNERAESREIVIEHLTSKEAQGAASTEVEFDEVNLKLFEVQSEADIVRINAEIEGPPSYFRVSKPSSDIQPILDDKSLMRILKEIPLGNTKVLRQKNTFRRVELAFGLVECGLYLLGTPWLAGISSQRIRRLKVGERRHPFVIEAQTLDIDDLAFDDPKALTETNQLFRIGVLLMEIAGVKLSKDPNLLKEPYLEISKMLPQVENSMGNEYSKATAFCLQDRRSAPYFGKPNKFRRPIGTGWTSYLTGLLRDYYAQVYLRLEELRAI